MIRLGVNIDHVATLRNARRTRYPNPIAAAGLVAKAGADQITVHLREDRRHITDKDVAELRRSVTIALNLEMSCSPEIVKIACDVGPDIATLVPEKREEITTEGGLDVVRQKVIVGEVIQTLKAKGIEVSLFIEPVKEQIDAAIQLGADRIEIHTGRYCDLPEGEPSRKELARIKEAAQYAAEKGLFVAAGHGLNLDSLEEVIRAVPEIEEYNIGHSIVSRAIFVGLEKAVEEVKELIKGIKPQREALE
ncbi:MAG: pyridoxine 5'-phosphate synthase [Deltaproteobacteria bacterium]|nr:pyridoxine 5'-phosphate synthase [Deltaproteobacteria bacterium]